MHNNSYSVYYNKNSAYQQRKHKTNLRIFFLQLHHLYCCDPNTTSYRLGCLHSIGVQRREPCKGLTKVAWCKCETPPNKNQDISLHKSYLLSALEPPRSELGATCCQPSPPPPRYQHICPRHYVNIPPPPPLPTTAQRLPSILLLRRRLHIHLVLVSTGAMQKLLCASSSNRGSVETAAFVPPLPFPFESLDAEDVPVAELAVGLPAPLLLDTVEDCWCWCWC